LADGWCWFVLREKYCWLVAGGWFVLREKYYWLVADKPSEQGTKSFPHLSYCGFRSTVGDRITYCDLPAHPQTYLSGMPIACL
jgi:hypothetical protein